MKLRKHQYQQSAKHSTATVQTSTYAAAIFALFALVLFIVFTPIAPLPLAYAFDDMPMEVYQSKDNKAFNEHYTIALDIFDEYLSAGGDRLLFPGISGDYGFHVYNNSDSYDMPYWVTFKASNPDSVPIAISIECDGTYVYGAPGPAGLIPLTSDLTLDTITLNGLQTDYYTLHWAWLTSSDLEDTAMGNAAVDSNLEYELLISVTGEDPEGKFFGGDEEEENKPNPKPGDNKDNVESEKDKGDDALNKSLKKKPKVKKATKKPAAKAGTTKPPRVAQQRTRSMPNTGDVVNIAALIALFGASAGIVVYAAGKRRKEDEEIAVHAQHNMQNDDQEGRQS